MLIFKRYKKKNAKNVFTRLKRFSVSFILFRLEAHSSSSFSLSLSSTFFGISSAVYSLSWPMMILQVENHFDDDFFHLSSSLPLNAEDFASGCFQENTARGNSRAFSPLREYDGQTDWEEVEEMTEKGLPKPPNPTRFLPVSPLASRRESFIPCASLYGPTDAFNYLSFELKINQGGHIVFSNLRCVAQACVSLVICYFEVAAAHISTMPTVTKRTDLHFFLHYNAVGKLDTFQSTLKTLDSLARHLPLGHP